jgi:hypothetical protein
MLVSCRPDINITSTADSLPPVFPDYSDVTIPVNIAPLNFRADTAVDGIYTRIEGSRSGMMTVKGGSLIDIPLKKWKNMLTDNAGETLHITVAIRRGEDWKQYKAFDVHISTDSIDYGLAYRLVAPGYEVYSKMGIYQRSLSDFKQTPILENTLFPACMNCHSFRAGDPTMMSLHIRGAHGATLLAVDGNVNLYNTKTAETIASAVYPYWHPSGRYIAYSTNETQQIFHANKDKLIEVYDMRSDVMVYDRQTNTLLSSRLICDTAAFETFPSFSPDGRTLYFCSANAQPMPKSFSNVKYSLCRIAFDPATGTFGDRVDTLFNAHTANQSASFPRPSYDGKYLMYTRHDYGNFSIWHKEADLRLIDLAAGDDRPLTEVNSDYTESYHSWSTNSRWFVFSSRRLDGQYTRPFIAHIDDEGRVSKPFLLPQRDPAEYEASFYSYNIPEFVNEPIQLSPSEVETKALSDERIQMLGLSLQ